MEIFQCKWADCHEIFNNHDDFVSHFKVEHEQWFISSATHEDDGHGKLQKTWSCQWRHGCKKQATRLENFRIHVRTHTGEKPFICDIAGCSKGFSNASDCNKHRIRAHTLEKYYECYAGDCTKRYKDPSSLRKHIIAIHGKDEYERLRKLNKIKRKNIPIFLDAILPNSSSSQLTIDQINTLQRISAEMIAENHYPSDAKTIPNTPRSEYSFFATPEDKDISRSMLTMSYCSSLNSLYSETFTSTSSMSNTVEKIGLCASIENIRNNSTYYQQLVHKMGFGNATLDKVVKYLQDVEKNGNNNQDTHIEIDENDSDCLKDSANSYNRITDGVLVRMANSEKGPFSCKTIQPEQVIEIDTKESLYVTTSLEEGLIPAFEILELQRRNGIPPERVKVPEEIRLYAASLSENDELDKNVPRSQVKTKAPDVDAFMQQLIIKTNENNPDQFNDL